MYDATPTLQEMEITRGGGGGVGAVKRTPCGPHGADGDFLLHRLWLRMYSMYIHTDERPYEAWRMR